MIDSDARVLVQGSACGSLLVSNTALSFWGGVDPESGQIIDQHHPLAGISVAGKILAVPSGRGSSSGSGALLELLMNERAPAALVFSEDELILTLGVLVAQTLFEKSIPVLQVNSDTFATLVTGQFAVIEKNRLLVAPAKDQLPYLLELPLPGGCEGQSNLQLNAADEHLLQGQQGRAAQVAMEVVCKMAKLYGASSLVDVAQVHIDACVYNGPSSLAVAQRLLDLDAQVQVPTTLNSLSVDKRRWRQQGVVAEFAEPAARLGDVFAQMGAQPTYTCAPYLLESSPEQGEQVAWAESNAVMFANSVIGARTLKYPDFLDICIALTGRAPNIGSHTDAGRVPTLDVRVHYVDDYAEAFWPLLGYHLGQVAGNQLPIIFGLENTQPTRDDLKAMSAAFATTSSTPMFHIVGVTPEAEWAQSQIASRSALPVQQVSPADLAVSFQTLNTAEEQQVSVVALGNPHFSLTECRALAELCRGRERHTNVAVMVTLGRTRRWLHSAA